MPKDIATGRIYCETVGGVAYGIVDPRDVGPIIGSTDTRVSALCTCPKINPDALFKPYEHTLSPLIPNFATGGPDGMYGYTIPNTLNDWQSPTFRNELWEFNTPQTYFNLVAFDGYYHKPRFAQHPWGVTFIETQYDIKCSCGWGGPVGMTCPKNMAIFQDCYLVVAIIEGQNNFLYAKCSQYKVSESVGDYFEIAKAAITLPSSYSSIVAVPFLAPLTGTALTALQTGTNNVNYLSDAVRKYNINYESKQYAYIYNTAPSEGIVIRPISPTIYESPYTFKLQVRVTNNYNSAQTGALYPVYIGYKETVAAGYTYLDPKTDEIVKTNKTVNFSLAAGASQVYTIEGLDLYLGTTVVRIDECDVIQARFVVPSGHSADTNYETVRLAQS